MKPKCKGEKNRSVNKQNAKKKKTEVEISGFEPEVSRMQSERSTTELYPQLDRRFPRMVFIAYSCDPLVSITTNPADEIFKRRISVQ